ncbi:MAG: hypothetical protein IPN76_26070 [Saprospiraceae bacterium]|nr:hypothetical protein [Saprospiraceae bacterium]
MAAILMLSVPMEQEPVPQAPTAHQLALPPSSSPTPTTVAPARLGQAILCVNADPALDTIKFNIPGNGVQVIGVNTTLPQIIANGVVIDATTQPGWFLGKVVIDGTNVPSNVPSFPFHAIHSANNAGFDLYGLVIRNVDFHAALGLSNFTGLKIGAPDKVNVFYNNAGNGEFRHQVTLQDCANGSVSSNIFGLDENQAMVGQGIYPATGLGMEARNIVVGEAEALGRVTFLATSLMALIAGTTPTVLPLRVSK